LVRAKNGLQSAFDRLDDIRRGGAWFRAEQELDNIVVEKASVKRVDSIANCAGLKIVEPLVGGWKERLGEYRQRPTELVCGLARGWGVVECRHRYVDDR